jgi:ABC-type antimicrobial peptide transport system permease subunit
MVSMRRREIGLRMALGAGAVGLARLVAAQAMIPVAIGLLLGSAAFITLRRSIAAFLFGVTVDPWSMAMVMLLAASVGIAAAIIPARRATRVEPIVALRDPD